MVRQTSWIVVMGLTVLALGCASKPQQREDDTPTRAQRVDVGNANTVTLLPDRESADRGYSTEALTGRSDSGSPDRMARRELLPGNAAH